MLDESEKSNEYISYKNEKWIKEKYCIPIQKIKAKIEELDIAISECIYLDEDDEKYKKAVKKEDLRKLIWGGTKDAIHKRRRWKNVNRT